MGGDSVPAGGRAPACPAFPGGGLIRSIDAPAVLACRCGAANRGDKAIAGVYVNVS